ncbi:MAG: (Fe-S)-binding protein [Promethearchaeota archaeon]
MATKIPEIADMIRVCTECGACRSVCPTFEYKKIESFNERGRLMLCAAWNQGELNASKSWIDRTTTCLQCRVCEEVCPPGVKYFDIVGKVREKLAEDGIGPIDSQKSIVQNILKSGNIFGQENKLKDTLLAQYVDRVGIKDSDYLFFTGCMANRRYSSFAVNPIRILEKTGLKLALDDEEECCAGVAKLVGMTKEFRQMAEKNMSHMDSLGVERVFTHCPMCFSTLKKEYPWSVEVVHETELFAQLIDDNKMKLERGINGKAAFFDPCHLGRWGGIYEAPRKILESIPGLELIELERNNNLSRCCGGPIRDPYIDFRNAISENTLDNATELEIEYLVTCCGTCFHSLQTVGMMEYDVQIVDIGELVAYSMKLIEEIPQHPA